MSISGSLAKINKDVNKSTSKVFNNGNKKPGKLGGMVDSVSGIQKNVAGTVVGVGNIVAKAAGTFGGKLGQKLANSLTGSTKIDYKPKNEKAFVGGLEGFYNQFSGLSQNLPDVLDPFNTFECSFTFFPSVQSVKFVKTLTKTQKATWIENSAGSEKIQDNIKNGTVTAKTLSTNETIKEETIVGSLLSKLSFKNIGYQDEYENGCPKQLSEEKRENTFSDLEYDSNVGETVKTEYENIETISRYDISKDFFINLGIYIQKVALPNVQIEGGEDVQTLMGKFPIPGKIVAPSDNTFSMDILNVRSPIIENIFYTWMRETTLPTWQYKSQPFTTALISFDFSEHCNIKYHFVGCRPTHVQLIQPDQAPVQNLTRNVQFTFDYMTIEKVETSQESKKQSKANMSSGAKNGNSKSNLANGALFSAINTLKL